jgi:hypothetical protein
LIFDDDRFSLRRLDQKLFRAGYRGGNDPRMQDVYRIARSRRCTAFRDPFATGRETVVATLMSAESPLTRIAPCWMQALWRNKSEEN